MKEQLKIFAGNRPIHPDWTLFHDSEWQVATFREQGLALLPRQDIGMTRTRSQKAKSAEQNGECLFSANTVPDKHLRRASFDIVCELSALRRRNCGHGIRHLPNWECKGPYCFLGTNSMN
jgi:hypothetical protein